MKIYIYMLDWIYILDIYIYNWNFDGNRTLAYRTLNSRLELSSSSVPQNNTE